MTNLHFQKFSLEEIYSILLFVIVLLLIVLPRSGVFSPAQTEDSLTRGLPSPADADTDNFPPLDSYNVTLRLDDGVLTAAGTGPMPALNREYSERELASVKTVVLDAGITALDAGAFRGCTRLRSLSLPEGLVSIGAEAFANCALETLTIPANTVLIAEGAFRGCTALKEIQVHPDNPAYRSADGVLLSADGSLLLCYPGGKSGNGYRVPEGVTRIADHAFCGFQLKDTLYLPASVTELGADALSRCYGLSAIKVDGANTAYSAEDGVLYDRDKRVLLRYPSAKAALRFTLPRGVEEIAPCAFCENYELTDLTIPEGVTLIGREAFSGCSFLSSLKLPQSLLSIGDEAFLSCSRMTKLRLPEGLSTLGARAFAYCYSLEDLTLPGSLRSVGEEAFLRCDSLRTARLSEGLALVSGGMFRLCGALERVDLPQSLKEIGAEAFADCAALKTLNYAGTQAQWDGVLLDPSAIPAGAALVFGG